MSRLDHHEIRQRAAGNWHGILTALGLPSESLANKHQPYPACGGTDRYRFDDKGGNGGFICTHYKNGAGDGFDLLMHYFGYSFHEAALAVAGVLGMTAPAPTAAPRVAPPPKTPPKDRLNKLAAIWEQAAPVSDGDPVSGYLQGRG
ncbi:MAG: primase-helicase zinc-binding domain-containing protein [Neisseria sp.]|uniref:primase-helicase zinc-binding domain-containing protein n=1 Tax=Neisseria sp. TaxID=192066 RepID=UPI0026DC8728|nr:primase-helicase zinc-binding domain-containing protein [Neisseria sp.]MDO4247558.1 primase-helicase zinc-binding domain-containing protein [Neisseria sp.]